MPHDTAREPDPTLPIPDEGDCGEAMRACTPGERAFVVALIESGGQKRTDAAYRAGLGNSINAAHVAACRMMSRPRVLAAIREMADQAMQGDALLGRAVLHEIAVDTQHKDRFKAAVELLNRAGLLVETRQRIIVQDDNRSTDQIMLEVEQQFKRLYGNRPLPIEFQKPIDAEFSEVRSSDGIEDLLS